MRQCESWAFSGAETQSGGPFAANWKTQMTSQGGREMSYFGALIKSIAWSTLVPDQSGTVFQNLGNPPITRVRTPPMARSPSPIVPTSGNIVANMGTSPAP